MASSSFLLFLFIFLSISDAYISNNAITFSVTKHPSSFHYTTEIHLASETNVPFSVLVDLGAPFTWANCATRSSSRRLVPCRSIQCAASKAHDCASTSDTCGSQIQNPFTGDTARGALTADVITAFGSFHESLRSDPVEFLYYCVTNSLFFRGLPSGLGGVLGLGGAASHLAMALALPRKFSIFLSPSGGRITIGESPSTPLTYTPLITTSKNAYCINVNGVKINGERADVTARMKLSTTSPYTVMKTTVYNSFIKVYTEAAEAMNMTRVAEVAPFSVCYAPETSGTRTPEVELVLQSEMVKWRIEERNLMVKMEDEEVRCLAILDGGLNSNLKEEEKEEDIVIGIHQLEDELLEFDLSSSMLGFSSSSSSSSSKYMML